MRPTLVVMFALGVLAGCERLPHYYSWCNDLDGNGWNLIDTEFRDGYLLACTYQSPDRTQSYTNRCDDNGCQ